MSAWALKVLLALIGTAPLLGLDMGWAQACLGSPRAGLKYLVEGGGRGRPALTQPRSSGPTSPVDQHHGVHRGTLHRHHQSPLTAPIACSTPGY
jgi:hypothetical protein